MKPNVTATDIINLLVSTRHADDLCVPECKDGPSQGCRHRRFDLWVMKRSYSKPCCIGYEVKVSRSDFFHDEKWKDYLPLCNQLFFVCPWGMIQPHEVPSNVGLLWVSKNIRTAHIKAKAEHREIDAPVDLMTYVLMSRAKIVPPAQNNTVDRVAYMKNWLASESDLKSLGYGVAHKIRLNVDAVKRENETLVEKIKSLENVKEFWCKSLGCKEYDLINKYSQRVEDINKQALQRLKTGIGPKMKHELGMLSKMLKDSNRLAAAIEDFVNNTHHE